MQYLANIQVFWAYFHLGPYILKELNVILEFFKSFHLGPCCHLIKIADIIDGMLT